MISALFKEEADFGAVTFEAWRALVEAELKEVPYDKKLVTRLYEGFDVQPLYVRDGTPRRPATSHMRTPGALGGDTGPKVVQERSEPTPQRVHACILEDLELGADGVHLCFDRAGRLGLSERTLRNVDPSEAVGCSIHCVKDLEVALLDVGLNDCLISLEAGASFLSAAMLLTQLWNERGDKPAQVYGAFNADPLGALAQHGRLPGALEHGFESLAEVVRLAEDWSGTTALRVSSGPYHNAGANAAQELAYTLATGLDYLRQLDARGLPPNRVAQQFVFSYSIGTESFLATAQLRAARGLWARILEECGVEESRRGMRMHVQMGSRALTKRDPWVNLLRNTACVFAAIIAGADSVTSVPFDAALGAPSALARRIARNTPNILKEEAHLARVVDPAAGSFLVEKLTTDLAEKAWAHLQEIERRGGMARALISGWIGTQVNAGLNARLANVATRRDVILGVTEFVNFSEESPPRNPEDEPGAGPERAPSDAPSPQVDDSAETLEQLSQAHWLAWQTSAPPAHIPKPLTPSALAQDFERLRDAADQHSAVNGTRPRVNLVNIGVFAEYNARSAYARSFFEVGGFQVLSHDGSEDADELAQVYADSGGGVAILCSTDARYEQMGRSVVDALRERGAKHLILAGNPGRLEEQYRAMGIDGFIFVRCDALTTLRKILQLEGVQI